MYFFEGNIQCADLPDRQLISKYNTGLKFLSCAIDTFSRY